MSETVRFYADVFDLESLELAPPGPAHNVLLLFPDQSFLHVVNGADYPITPHPARVSPGNLLYEGAPLDHIALFASDAEALKTIRTRLLALPGRLVNRAGHPTLRLPTRWPWANRRRSGERSSGPCLPPCSDRSWVPTLWE